jgi:hypothetical protein
MTKKAKPYLAQDWIECNVERFDNPDEAEKFLIACGGGTIKIRRREGWTTHKMILPENRKIGGEEYFMVSEYS